MKIKVSLLLLIVFSMLNQSCSDDDEVLQSEIIGAWSSISFIGEIKTTYILDGSTTASNTIFEGLNSDYTLNFSDDSFTTAGMYNINFATTVQGNTVMNLDPYFNVNNNGAYSISENEMVLDGQLFDIEFNGAPITLGAGSRVTEYDIMNGTLIISETHQTTVTETSGLMSVTDISLISSWKK